MNLIKKMFFFLLDVRTKAEYSYNRIPGSINLPLDEVADKIEKIISVKNLPIYVYCLSGSRSRIAASQMNELGYKKVFNLKSGLLAWRSLDSQ